MAVLRVDHPDIEEFITCKTRRKRHHQLQHLGRHHRRLHAGGGARRDWELRFPDVGAPNTRPSQRHAGAGRKGGRALVVHKRVRARDLFDKIVRQAHHNGEPGVLFLDAANRENPVPHLYQLEATNPCGEQCLGPYENCCLGSINLAQHLTPDGHGRLGEAAPERRALHALPGRRGRRPTPTCRRCRSCKEAAHRARRIGLGIMGLGDLMYHAGHPLRLGRGAGVRRAGHGVRALPLRCSPASSWPRSAGPSPPSRAASTTPRTSQWQPPVPLVPLQAAIGAARRGLGRVVHGHQAARHPQRRADHRGPHRDHRHGRGLRGLRLRAGLRPGLHPPRQRQRPGPQAALHQPAVRARADGRRAGRGANEPRSSSR